jgi:hypothetical protein
LPTAPAIPPSVEDEEEEYRLSDEAPRPTRPRPTPVDDDLEIDLAPERAEEAPRRERASVPDQNPFEAADSMVQERRPSLEERLEQAAKDRHEAEPPAYPFLSGVFGFLLYSSTWPRWVGLTMGTALVYFLAAGAAASARSGGAELFISLLFAITAGSAALLLVFFEAVAVLAIVQDTAAGADEIEGWPDFVFVDWAGQAFYFLNALAFSVAPGFLLATFMDSWGPIRWVLPAVSAAFLYPIVLLSQLDGMSPFSILTPGVLKGLFRSPKAWTAFYAVALLVILAAAAVYWLAVRIAGWDGIVAAVAAAVVVTTAMMLVHRLIGRLAWFCEETQPVVTKAAPVAETTTQESGDGAE